MCETYRFMLKANSKPIKMFVEESKATPVLNHLATMIGGKAIPVQCKLNRQPADIHHNNRPDECTRAKAKPHTEVPRDHPQIRNFN